MTVSFRCNLKSILEEKKISQSKLSHMADVNPNTISKYCRGNVTQIDSNLTSRIMKALELKSMDELFTVEISYN